MGRASEEDIRRREANQKWYTTRCAECGIKFPVTAEDYSKEQKGLDPNWCPDCHKKLFSREK